MHSLESNSTESTLGDGDNKRGYKPAPKGKLKGFPDSKKIKTKGGRARWQLDQKGKMIGEWDSQHGEVEVYKNGKHQGAFDPETGNQIKQPVPGRKPSNFTLQPSQAVKQVGIWTTIGTGAYLLIDKVLSRFMPVLPVIFVSPKTTYQNKIY